MHQAFDQNKWCWQVQSFLIPWKMPEDAVRERGSFWPAGGSNTPRPRIHDAENT